MRKISVINYKGGTGKTCTVVSLAHKLALEGYRVLIIDTDPQGSAGRVLGVTPKHTLYDLLIDSVSPSDCIVNARENLDIICSNERLFPAEMKMASMKRREFILSERLRSVFRYDFIILDCAPSLNLMNQNALAYTNEVILPVSMEYLALVGVKQLLKNIKIINKLFRKQLVVCKVVPTFFDQQLKKSKDILTSLKRVFPGSTSNPIRICLGLSESPGYKQTIFEYDPESSGAEDYSQLAKEVLAFGRRKSI